MDYTLGLGSHDFEVQARYRYLFKTRQKKRNNPLLPPIPKFIPPWEGPEDKRTRQFAGGHIENRGWKIGGFKVQFVHCSGQAKFHTSGAASRLIHTASLLAVYASSFGFPALARLASGRVAALTEWVSNPLDFKGEFQSGYVSPDIPTPQALPGARTFPGRIGRLPSQSPHRPVRARLTHTVPRDMDSLRILVCDTRSR